MAYTFDAANAKSPSRRHTQYFEMFANRAIYHDGWIAATTPPEPPWLLGAKPLPPVLDYKWELYNIDQDFSEYNDLAAKNPGKLKELQELFMAEAKKYQVLPLDNSVLSRIITPRPSATAGRALFTYSGEMPGLPESDAPSILNRSYSITAEIEVPEGGAEGVLVTDGGRFGGYALYLLKGKPVFLYNFIGLEKFRWEAPDTLASGKHTIVFDFKYDGPGPGKGGTGILTVDGNEVANQKIPHTIPFLITIDETFDVGMDTRTPVDDKEYQVPFRFTGTLDKLTVKLGPPQLTDADRKKAAEMDAAAHDDR
jgi:arylsulfatase